MIEGFRDIDNKVIRCNICLIGVLKGDKKEMRISNIWRDSDRKL